MRLHGNKYAPSHAVSVLVGIVSLTQSVAGGVAIVEVDVTIAQAHEERAAGIIFQTLCPIAAGRIHRILQSNNLAAEVGRPLGRIIPIR